MAGNSKNKNKSNKNGKSSKGGKKSNKSKISARLLISLVIVAVLAGGFFVSLNYEDKIDEALGFRKVEVYDPGEMVMIGGLSIHFIDVGQGDACLIELPDDRTMLIDAGENNKTVKGKLKEYIQQVNEDRKGREQAEIEYFDYVIATHSDSDHIGSMAYILDLYPAAVFYRPNEKATASGYTDPAESGINAKNKFWGEKQGEKDTATYKNALTAGYAAHSNFVEGIVTNPHDDTQNRITPDYPAAHDLYYEINFYGPVSSYYSDHNNYSPIILIEYKGRTVALSGDSEAKGEADFAAAVAAAESGSRYYPLKSSSFYADIIKLGHHGSVTSSGEDYLNVMTSSSAAPNIYIVISVNEKDAAKKKWTHPNPAVIERVKNIGIKEENILRTDEDGDILFALNFYQESSTALIERAYGGIVTTVVYPKQVAGITIKYRLIGYIVLIVLALALIPTSFIKKAKKKFK